MAWKRIQKRSFQCNKGYDVPALTVNKTSLGLSRLFMGLLEETDHHLIIEVDEENRLLGLTPCGPKDGGYAISGLKRAGKTISIRHVQRLFPETIGSAFVAYWGPAGRILVDLNKPIKERPETS